MRRWSIAIVFAACGWTAERPPAPGSATPVAIVAADAAADAFWTYVTAHATALAAEPLEAAMDELQRALSLAHPGVLVELGADGPHRTLVLTADGDRALFPQIQAMYATRPTIAGWDVVAFRQRETSRPLAHIEIGTRSLDPQQLHYVAAPAAGKLDVVVYVPGYTETDTAISQMVYIALDHVVGEYDVETRIGAISIASADKAPSAARPFPELAAELSATSP